MRTLMAAATARGWRGAVAHFRGCSGEINLRPRAYHSGDSAEVDWILRRFQARHPDSPRFAVGISLGANALLKWLGEQAEAATSVVSAAAGISAPQDLHEGARALARGFNRIYTANFLKSLKRKSLRKLEQFPGLFDRRRMLESTSFFEFDDAVTAPMHGFKGCLDYWRKSSCKQFLRAIHVPTLVLNACNDPFLPARHLARRDQVSSRVELDYPAHGGHVGFVQGRFPGRQNWLVERVCGFLEREAIHAANDRRSLETTDG
ncbi:MAG: alpha/beta fold hydrolase [Burkholderiaceae bacterium]